MLSNFVGCGPKRKIPFWASSVFIFLFVLAPFMEGAYSKGEGSLISTSKIWPAAFNGSTSEAIGS